MDRPRLLAIFAHPDDESFGPGGALARYAAQGIEVHVCTVTDGAAGAFDPAAPMDVETPSLAALRRAELACACQVLGAHSHTLGYRDSGMQGAADNQHPHSLFQADLDDVAGDLVHVIRQVRPQVVLTHDPSGGYFHPDHIKVSRAVSRAWELTGTEGGAPWQPARLYYTVIPRSTLKWFVRILRLLGRDPRRFGHNQDIDVTQVGVPDAHIHVRLDVSPYLALKEQASACHRSQGGGGATRLFPAFARRRFMRYEHFVQAQPPGASPHQDLFVGLS